MRQLVFLALLLPILPGCVLDFDLDDWGASSDALLLRDAEVRGDLGDVRGVVSRADPSSAYRSNGVLYAHLEAEGEGWKVMHVLDFEIAHFRVGETYDSTTANVSVVGCSGPPDGYWEFDEHADHVVVTTEEGSSPSRVRVRYRAEYVDPHEGTQVATGSFEVAAD